MTKQRHRTFKSLIAIVLAFLIAGIFVPVTSCVFAEGGNISIALSSMEGVGDDFPGFSFKLYKVGHYDGPDLVLDEDYEKAKVTLPSDSDLEEWLAAASKLANYIEHPADGQSAADPVKSFASVKPGGSMSYDSADNSLYLLIGETVRYDNMNYTPVPMFVGTVNEDSSFTIDATIKVSMDPIVFEHSVIKTWDDEENKDGVRPDTIEVGIYYGSILIDRITLGGDEGVWTYKWKSEESGDTYVYIGEKDGKEVRISFKPGASDKAWGVREFTDESEMTDASAKAAAPNLIYYEPEYSKSSSESLELFIINNPYCPPEEPDNPPDEPDNPPHNVDTGDTNNLLLWCCIAGGACVLLGGFGMARRKRKNEGDNE